MNIVNDKLVNGNLVKRIHKNDKTFKYRGRGYKCDKRDILRYKKITYKKILCILVETIEVLFMKKKFASKYMSFPSTNI